MFDSTTNRLKKQIRASAGTSEAIQEIRQLRDELRELGVHVTTISKAVEELRAVGQQLNDFQVSLPERLAAAMAAQSRPIEPLAEPSAVVNEGALPVKSLRKLGRQGLFIVGCARSGTTILTKCLNRSPEVFMLEESNFFLNGDNDDFTAFFNAMHEGWGNCRYKGTYVPPPMVAERGPLAMLARLAQRFRHVGEKVAFGPHDYPSDWARRYLDYQARYFLWARYILIVRAPTESIWSMHKKFPGRPLARLFETWLRSLTLSIEVYRNFPFVRLIHFERLGPQLMEQMAEFLGTELTLPEGMLSQQYIHSRLADDELPAPLSEHADWCRECLAIHRELRDHTTAECLLDAGTENEWEFLDRLQRKITLTTERIGG